MRLINFFKKCEAKNKIIIKDIKNLSFCEKIRLANFWGVKHLFFNVTQVLIKETIHREKNCIRLTNAIKKLKSSNCNEL